MFPAVGTMAVVLSQTVEMPSRSKKAPQQNWSPDTKVTRIPFPAVEDSRQFASTTAAVSNGSISTHKPWLDACSRRKPTGPVTARSWIDGIIEGTSLGKAEGASDGVAEGDPDGASDGSAEGVAEGSTLREDSSTKKM